MMRYRFVKPEEARLDLSDGDWVIVKKKLTASEEHAYVSRITKWQTVEGKATPELAIDVERYALERLNTYLLEWSFVDEDGRPFPLNAAAIGALEMETVREIQDAMDTYFGREKVSRE